MSHTHIIDILQETTKYFSLVSCTPARYNNVLVSWHARVAISDCAGLISSAEKGVKNNIILTEEKPQETVFFMSSIVFETIEKKNDFKLWYLFQNFLKSEKAIRCCEKITKKIKWKQSKILEEFRCVRNALKTLFWWWCMTRLPLRRYSVNVIKICTLESLTWFSKNTDRSERNK